MLSKAKIFILPALLFTSGFRNARYTAGEKYKGTERNIKETHVFSYPKANMVLSGLHSSHFFEIRTVFKGKPPSLLSYLVILNTILNITVFAKDWDHSDRWVRCYLEYKCYDKTIVFEPLTEHYKCRIPDQHTN